MGAMTVDDLVARGRALYGERWQTSLALDLAVADRTMRRWLAGESSIPGDVEQKLRELLIKRLNEMGGMIGYSVNHSNHMVVHHPTAACFHYDDAGNLTLLNPMVLTSDNIPLITQGAAEAVRNERERPPGVIFGWHDSAGRRSGAG
jgi:hypothetical protein